MEASDSKSSHVTGAEIKASMSANSPTMKQEGKRTHEIEVQESVTRQRGGLTPSRSVVEIGSITAELAAGDKEEQCV